MGPGMIHKFYPGGRDKVTKGMSYQEIADLTDEYVKVYEATHTSSTFALIAFI